MINPMYQSTMLGAGDNFPELATTFAAKKGPVRNAGAPLPPAVPESLLPPKWLQGPGYTPPWQNTARQVQAPAGNPADPASWNTKVNRPGFVENLLSAIRSRQTPTPVAQYGGFNPYMGS